jgi:hypothetical protein
MLAYAEKLTLAPSEMREADVRALRAHGFSDRAILDIALMAGLFNLYNRVVDGLGGYTFDGMADEAARRGIAGWRQDLEDAPAGATPVTSTRRAQDADSR